MSTAEHETDDVSDDRKSLRTEVSGQAETSERVLSPEAKRALKEAEERRLGYETAEKDMPRELGGRGGREPSRYGDWEIKGIAVDF